MTNFEIVKESKKILREFGTTERTDGLLCPILKILQMRHKNIDTGQAVRIIKEVLHD